MKKIIIFMMLLLTISFVSAEEEIMQDKIVEDDLYDEEFNKAVEEDIYADIGDVRLKGDAGLTPDSNFYFLENMVESIMVGDDPKKALEYKEEKVLELKEMVASNNEEGAEKVLERVEKYNKIIKKEVSPSIEKEVRASSKAVKEELQALDLEGLENIQEAVDQNLKEEDKIALAAKISTKIAELCEALSALDPLEYSKVCKTDDDAPQWKRDLDKKLTAEQREEAEQFLGIMSECFESPSECRCDDISVKPFAEQCKVIAPLAARCETGDESACKEMDQAGDPIDLLPDYLQEVMEELENRYSDAKYDLHIPTECVEAGATTKDACMKVMFKLNAPEECQKALEQGKIDPKNEKEAREACESIMFDLEAPDECKEAGLRDFRECERYMFKLDAPPECLDAGLTGSGRDDRKKCDAIRFKLEAPPECLEAGIDGTKRDDWKRCEVIKFKLDAPQECIDSGLTGEGRDDWKKCEVIKFRLDAPPECLDAGLTGEGRSDWKECEVIRFKLDAPQECLDAGLTGRGRDDWKKCDAIRFKLEAPRECLDAGLDGSGRRDWDECKKISEAGSGQRREDCGGEQLHICDENGKNCRCVDKGTEESWSVETSCGNCADRCGGRRWECSDGKCECFEEDGYEQESPRERGGGCGDCASKCSPPSGQRLRGTDCVNNQCQCYYESEEHDEEENSGSDSGISPDTGSSDSETGSSGSETESSGESSSSSESSSAESGSDSEEESSSSAADESSSSDGSGSSSGTDAETVTGSATGIFEDSNNPFKSLIEYVRRKIG